MIAMMVITTTTPPLSLRWAYEYSRAEMIKILLAAGADPAAKVGERAEVEG